MKTETAYCSGCGHQVRLVLTDGPPRDGQANLPDGAEVVCLDFHEGCSGGKCPATGTSGIVMGVRLVRSHLNDEAFKTIRAHCEGCGEVAELEILDATFALCPLCGTTNRWIVLELADRSRIALTGQ